MIVPGKSGQKKGAALFLLRFRAEGAARSGCETLLHSENEKRACVLRQKQDGLKHFFIVKLYLHYFAGKE